MRLHRLLLYLLLLRLLYLLLLRLLLGLLGLSPLRLVHLLPRLRLCKCLVRLLLRRLLTVVPMLWWLLRRPRGLSGHDGRCGA